MSEYRGKPVTGGEFVYGGHCEILEDLKLKHYIVLGGSQLVGKSPKGTWITGLVEVHPASVGQGTGRKDREGAEIYDKDIVKLSYGIPPTFDTLVIEYADDETVGDISVSGWWMRNIRKNGVSGSLCKTYENDLEVIGNTIDNPKLLEK